MKTDLGERGYNLTAATWHAMLGHSSCHLISIVRSFTLDRRFVLGTFEDAQLAKINNLAEQKTERGWVT
jgi:hypothetical protein